MKSLASLTTSPTGHAPAPTEQSSTGLQHGKHGSAVALTNEVMVLESTLETERNLLQRLPRSLTTWIMSDGDTAALETQWNLYGLPKQEMLQAALAVTMAAMAPAEMPVLFREITRLRLLTKARDDGAETTTMADRAMAEALQEWPGDVVVASLRELARASTFFPSLAEIVAICRERTLMRRNIHRCLRLVITTHSEPAI